MVVDESDGTIIDDDNVLLQLKDKVFILLESAEEWTSPKRSASHSPESVYSAATFRRNTVSASGKEATVSHAVPRVGAKTDVNKQGNAGGFTEALQSLLKCMLCE